MKKLSNGGHMAWDYWLAQIMRRHVSISGWSTLEGHCRVADIAPCIASGVARSSGGSRCVGRAAMSKEKAKRQKRRRPLRQQNLNARSKDKSGSERVKSSRVKWHWPNCPQVCQSSSSFNEGKKGNRVIAQKGHKCQNIVQSRRLSSLDCAKWPSYPWVSSNLTAQQKWHEEQKRNFKPAQI